MEQAAVPLLPRREYEPASYDQTSYNFHHMESQREPLRVDPQHERLLGMEDDYPSAAAMPSALATSSENNRLSAISCVHQALTPIGASNSAYPDRQLKNAYGRVGPLHDLSGQEPSQDSEGGIPPPDHSLNLPRRLYQQTQSDSPHFNPQVAAQLALSTLASTNRRHRQKEEMLAGRHYFPFDEELILRRERYRRACWRLITQTLIIMCLLQSVHIFSSISFTVIY